LMSSYSQPAETIGLINLDVKRFSRWGASGLACHAAVRRDPALRGSVAGVGPPSAHVDDAGRHQLETLQEPGHLVAGAERLRVDTRSL
jgi:hypothetical protein